MQKIKTKKKINRKKNITKRKKNCNSINTKKQIKFKNHNYNRFTNINKNKKNKRKQLGGIMIKNNLEQLTNFTTIDSTLPCLRGRLCLPCSLNSIGIDTSLLIDIIQKLESDSKDRESIGEKANTPNKILEYINIYKKNFYEKKKFTPEEIEENKDIIYLIGRNEENELKVIGGEDFDSIKKKLLPFNNKYRISYNIYLSDAIKIIFNSFLNGTSSLLFLLRPLGGHIVGISKSSIHGIPYLFECQTFGIGDKGQIKIGYNEILEYLIELETQYLGFFAPANYFLQNRSHIIDYIPQKKRNLNKLYKSSNNTILRDDNFSPTPIARLVSFEHGKEIETNDDEIEALLQKEKICIKNKDDEIRCLPLKDYNIINKKDLDKYNAKKSGNEVILDPLKSLKISELPQSWVYDLVKAGYIPAKPGSQSLGVFNGSEEKLLELYDKALIRNPRNETELQIIEDLLHDLQEKKKEKEKEKEKEIVEDYDSDDLYN